MTKQQFNIEIAERVMGWETRIVPTVQSSSGYLYDADDSHIYGPGPDFATDHNAAALVRARVVELGKVGMFILHLTQSVVIAAGLSSGWTYDKVFALVDATPAQTARAAFYAVTGENLKVPNE